MALFDLVFWLCNLRSSLNLLGGWGWAPCEVEVACCWRCFLESCLDFGRVMTAPEAVTSLLGMVGCGCMPPPLVGGVIIDAALVTLCELELS